MFTTGWTKYLRVPTPTVAVRPRIRRLALTTATCVRTVSVRALLVRSRLVHSHEVYLLIPLQRRLRQNQRDSSTRMCATT